MINILDSGMSNIEIEEGKMFGKSIKKEIWMEKKEKKEKRGKEKEDEEQEAEGKSS